MRTTTSTNTSDAAPTSDSAADYRFEHFRMKHVLDDMTFSGGAKIPGDSISNATLYSADGPPISLQSHAARRPVLILTGSVTCPMTASSIPDLNELYRQYGDRVAFVQLVVREAHPGGTFAQPHDITEKVARARALREQFDVEFPVLVDDIDGTLHRELDSIANSAHLVAPDGTLAFRSLWAGDHASIERALADITAGRAVARPSSTRMAGPATRSLGYIRDVIKRAGSGAGRDLVIGAPPMAVMGTIASLFRFVPRQRRGVFAIASSIVFFAAFAAAAVLWLR